MTIESDGGCWILFDAADTLIRPEPDVATAYSQIAAEFGLSRDPVTVRSRFRAAMASYFADERSSETTDRARWQSLVFDVLETDDLRVFERLWSHFAAPGSWRLFEDVSETWNELDQLGFQLGVASNFDRRLLRIVSQTPTIQAARHVFVSSELGYRKPNPHFFKSIERLLGSRPLMVGDSLTADYQGAKQAGWSAVHLDRSSDPGSARGAKISSLRQLPTRLATR